ncbi:nuclear protein localization protein 4 homolog isoform X2 [Xenia sp. Carnegie-2017]|uniref:nuclear protein localization protein 4 homolog isoform X2 n=1 Tax=Xenia sp. Carnegie-2017 TaxID=2897299 RepID=UPI001F039A73|nr:nuclear protein localization protein 4 homolog isoform X2 [Xenia sp. Carnegie-2017]
MSKPILIRVQSRHGTKRINTFPNESVRRFLEKIREEFQLSANTWNLYLDRGKNKKIPKSSKQPLTSLNLRHGDMVYLDEAVPTKSNGVETLHHEMNGKDIAMNGTITSRNEITDSVKEDPIDIFLSKQDGLIHRDKDPQLCHHGPKSKCVHCFPLEPYDETYLKNREPPIKHLSFHAYLKKLTQGQTKGKYAVLENITCKIKPGCKEHPPWPDGICTKCQPSAITLKRQEYRHVDNIMFENPFLVERFLNYWRKTGKQRLGYLYGRYEYHKDVPLGIRAVVAAIYEPPQVSESDRVQLLDDPQASILDEVAKKVGVEKIGWIVTDLVAENLQLGTVCHLRHKDTYYVSAEECIMAADFQNKHPNVCKLSPNNKFGSKFVTVIVTGHKDKQISFDGWQVSNQCMALVKDDILFPTKDEPGLGYIRESTSKQYVPDVFYKDKDSYGNEVTLLARPMPIEYVLIEVPAAFPKDNLYTFPGGNGDPFPLANRQELGEIQDIHSFAKYIKCQPRTNFLNAMSDLHLLTFMATIESLPLKHSLDMLLEAIKTSDEGKALDWSKSEEWAIVEELIQSQDVGEQSLGAVDTTMTDGGVAQWTCEHCTFINESVNNSCEMCGLPRN